MKIDEYQGLAQATDQFSDTADGKALLIPMLGIIGEMGSLATCFKKRMRDNENYELFLDDLKNEIGDVLWYVANLATKWDFKLSEVAQKNLEKNKDRWISTQSVNINLLDEKYPTFEQIPRILTVKFLQGTNEYLNKDSVVIEVNDEIVGDELTDNAYESDGYRFHDVFHLSYAAFLGWSPVLRTLMNVKRKSANEIDEVEDGARARIIEEAISLYVFTYAKQHNLLSNIKEIDFEVLKTIKSLVSYLEVKNETAYQWKKAILEGYRVYRELKENSGGEVTINLNERSITYKKPEGKQ